MLCWMHKRRKNHYQITPWQWFTSSFTGVLCGLKNGEVSDIRLGRNNRTECLRTRANQTSSLHCPCTIERKDSEVFWWLQETQRPNNTRFFHTIYGGMSVFCRESDSPLPVRRSQWIRVSENGWERSSETGYTSHHGLYRFLRMPIGSKCTWNI